MRFLNGIAAVCYRFIGPKISRWSRNFETKTKIFAEINQMRNTQSAADNQNEHIYEVKQCISMRYWNNILVTNVHAKLYCNILHLTAKAKVLFYVQQYKLRREGGKISIFFSCFRARSPSHTQIILLIHSAFALSLSVHSYSIYSNWKSSSVFGYILVIIIPMQCILHITKIRLEFRKEEILNIENSKKNKQ